jgi:toxin YoeB
MTYNVILEPGADSDVEKHVRAGNTILVNRIGRLLEELRQNPYAGTGKPHRLKHYKDDNIWSRSIDDRHRMVYKIEDNVVTIVVISLWGHYGDK